MTDHRPSVHTIPLGRAFADALATGLIERSGGDVLALAHGTIILPSNRAASAVQSAFVRAAGAGLMLPRLVALGDSDLAESAGLALDDGDLADPLPPAVEPLRRRLILSRLIIANCQKFGIPLAAPASLRLADALARVVDQLHFEGLDPAALASIADTDVAKHWDVSMRHLQLLLDQWPTELGRLGAIDLADRRNRQLDRLAARWRVVPPPGFVVAAGISVTAPAVARLLRVIADMPDGMVLLPGLDTAMPDVEWDALGTVRADPPAAHSMAPQSIAPRPLDSHPQYQFKLLLDRMGIARDEVSDWPAADREQVSGRAALASALFVPSRFTANWRERVPSGATKGIRTAEFADDRAEAQGIALLLRHALETPGRTAALVTPDRMLATRVSSALARWGLTADDSAGQPLTQTPAGTLARLAMAAATQRNLVPLLALLSHPLVASGEARSDWIAQVRSLDKHLRGPGKPRTPARIAEHLAAAIDRLREKGETDEALCALALWWDGVAADLAPLWSLADDDGPVPPVQALEVLRELVDRLSGGAIWTGVAGRQLGALFDRWQFAAPDGPVLLALTAIAHQLDDLLAGELVRAAFGSHPRLFIWGLLEARLQRADFMILGGLNEGGWPAEVSPDPWLAPGIRRQLGLPSVERAQGLAAHDFVTALAAPDVVVTRAQRQGSDPAVASRLWLRMTALAGPLPAAMIDGRDVSALAAALDRPLHAPRPAAKPSVAVGARPTKVRLTALDTLATDPYAFYAEHIAGLRPLDKLGEAADARWRGVRVHRLIEIWAKNGGGADALETAIDMLATDAALDPVEAAAWLPRIAPALRWVGRELALALADGRKPVGHEISGHWTVGGITVSAKADRIDQGPDGLIVVDYKSGSAPQTKEIVSKHAMQLGLLGAMIEAGAFPDIPDIAPSGAEYWLLKPNDAKTSDGHIKRPYGGRLVPDYTDMVELACAGLAELTATYLTGDAPFAPGEKGRDIFDHLSRRDEWAGRAVQEPL